jgi:hypothetical protein
MYIAQGPRLKGKKRGLQKTTQKNPDFLLHPRFNLEGDRMHFSDKEPPCRIYDTD